MQLTLPLNGWKRRCVILALGLAAGGCAIVQPVPQAVESDQSSPNCPCSSDENSGEEASLDGPADDGPAGDEAKEDEITGPDERYAVTSEELTFESRGAELVGVIDRPEAVEAPLSAVVMLHDSGPMDRRGLFDGALGLKLPVEVAVYEEISENLARRGYLVMRFDKRTCVEGGPPWCSYPREYVEDHRAELAGTLVDDATAAVEAVRARRDVAPDRVHLLGHGQGAELGLAVADDVDARSLVLLTPSPYPLDEVILHQTEASAAHLQKRREAEGNTTMGTLVQEQLDALAASRQEQQKAFAQLRADKVDDAAVLGAPRQTWMGFFALHERAMARLANVEVPVLAIFGGDDLNLPAGSAEEFQKRLNSSAAVQVKQLAGLTHPLVALDGHEDAAATRVSHRVHRQIGQFLEHLEQSR